MVANLNEYRTNDGNIYCWTHVKKKNSYKMAGKELNSKPARNKRSAAVKRRHRQIAYLAICSLSVIIFALALTTLIKPAHAEGRRNYTGIGTTHESLGQPHYENAKYTTYNHTSNYTKDMKFTSEAMHPVYNFTHFLFDKILYNDPAIPPGEL